MLRNLITASLLAASLFPAQASAAACTDRTKLVGHLAEKYGEALQSMGLAANNAILEVYASDETGTWTVVVTTADGKACILASGQHFETADPGFTPAKGTLL